MGLFPAAVAAYTERSDVFEYTPSQVAGETLLVGDLCVWDDGNNWVERAGANPTAIIGISEVSSEAARVLTPNGKIPIRQLNERVIVALSSTTTLTEAAHRQQEYGITRATGGQWQLDTSKTGGTARVLVIDVDETLQIAYCRFLSEFLATDGIDS